MTLLARMGLAFAAGLAAVAGMAPFNLWPLLILALAALFVLTDGAARGPCGIRRAAWTGWAFGFGYFGAGLYWIGEAFFVDPDTIWMMPFAVTLLPAGLALFHAAACALGAAIPRRGAAGALVLTASFGGIEFVRGFIFTGFPWNLFGSAFIDTPVAQAAAIGGVYGLTALTLLAGFSLPPLFGPRGAARIVPFATAFGLLAAAFAYGEWHRAAYAQMPAQQPARVRVVQPDNPQSEKGRADYLRRLWQRLAELTSRPGADGIDVFVWPEGVIAFLDESPEAMAAMGNLLRPGQILIAGTARREIGDDRSTRYYNSLLVIDPNGIAVAVYDKAHLVPFGEYLPLPGFFRWLDIDSLTARVGGAFTAGPGRRTLRFGGAPPFSPLICYEILFPAEVVEPGDRPGWLVNITDDSWFGTQTGPHQHLVAARFRAIEEGLPVVRSATTGISAVIDATGKVLTSRPSQVADSFDADLPPSFPSTVFSGYAHTIFALFLVGLLVAGLAIPATQKQSRAAN